MAYELVDLVIDRVDLVDEGANSAAFIEFYKRKESSEPMDFNEILSKLKPEHAEVITKAFEESNADVAKAREELAAATQNLANKESELSEVNEALAKANAEIEALKAEAPVAKSAEDTEEEILKGMPEEARALLQKYRAQKEAAEEQVRKNAAEKAEAEAIAKAANLKAIPVEQAKLVDIMKGISPEMYDILCAANTAIEEAVLGEVGKNRGNGAAQSETDAWSKIQAKAVEIAKRDGITVEKAVSTAVSENPELYKQYLEEVRD